MAEAHGLPSPKEHTIDLVAVRCANGTIALRYPVTNSPPKVQLPAAATVSATAGQIPARSGPPRRNDPESGDVSSDVASVAGYLFLISVAVVAFIAVVISVFYYYHNNPPPKHPKLGVTDFRVANFSISGPAPAVLTAAAWKANLTAVNSNGKFSLYLKNINAFVYYRSFVLAMSAADPLLLDRKSSASVAVNPVSYYTETDELVERLRREVREYGAVSFGIAVHLVEEFRRGENTNDATVATVYCEGLRVGFEFSGDFWTGTLVKGRSSEVSCRVSYCSWWKVMVTKTPFC